MLLVLYYLKGFGHERVSCIHITEDSRFLNIHDSVKRIYGPIVQSDYAGKKHGVPWVKIYHHILIFNCIVFKWLKQDIYKHILKIRGTLPYGRTLKESVDQSVSQKQGNSSLWLIIALYPHFGCLTPGMESHSFEWGRAWWTGLREFRDGMCLMSLVPVCLICELS